MDHGVRVTWYDLPADREAEYLEWMHGEHLPEMLNRPGYLWAAHFRNIDKPPRTHGAEDMSLPTGMRYVVIFGAQDAHTLVDPAPEEIYESLSARDKELIDLREGERTISFTEITRSDGPDVSLRRPGITPGPVIQFGTYNANWLDHEAALNTWYARSVMPMVEEMQTIGARRLLSISGWAKFSILYEFKSMEDRERFGAAQRDDPTTSPVVNHLTHTPHSPTIGERIWPPFE